jgi:NADPH:quinone reductase-like Zn-dependent oxidoreductase
LNSSQNNYYTMKAIVLDGFGDTSHLVIKDVDPPKPTEGFVLIRVKAFGVNHAETHMRKGEWAEAMPIIGVECVGIVEACPTGEFAPGTAVAALMGGLGRTINGSYAEYTNAPVSNVVSFGSGDIPLPWHELAAIPESYATAWTFLFRNLEIKPGQKLLIRGATSALGRAAVNLAVNHGAKVTGTTRNPARNKDLLEMGVESVVTEGPDLPNRLNLGIASKFDAVLNLVGNSVLLESLTLVRRGGRLCLGGWLGGLAPIKEFNPLLEMVSDVQFSFFGSFTFGQPEFPVSDVPLHDIVKLIADGKFQAKPSKVFKFDEIREAHKTMEANLANGKMVVLGFE